MTVVFFFETLTCFGADDKPAGHRYANEGKAISSWAGWRPGQISRKECPKLNNLPLLVNWDKLEPAPGENAFEKYLGHPLKAAAAEGLPVTL